MIVAIKYIQTRCIINMKTCAFTGHRPQNLPFGFEEKDRRCRALKKLLRREIIRQIKENGVTHFITGMALGTDMYAAEIVLMLKSRYRNITLECAIPCQSQADKWSPEQQARYRDIVSRCDKQTLIQRMYTADCMHRRNRYMVDQADVLIAVWDGGSGGTGMTVQYAQGQGKPVTVIHPISLMAVNA